MQIDNHVEARQLDWEHCVDDKYERWAADSPFGLYEVCWAFDRGNYVVLFSGSGIEGCEIATLSEAKAAAQADFEKRVKECLVAAPTAQGEVEPCVKCGQTDIGQYGEYPCQDCGLPILWDESAPTVAKAETVEEYIPEDWDEQMAEPYPAKPAEPVSVPAAVKALSSAMKTDPKLAWAWHCNVAMTAVDAGAQHDRANEYAATFMRNAFGVDTYSQVKDLLAAAPAAGGES